MRRRLFHGGEEYRARALDKNKARGQPLPPAPVSAEERQDGVHNEIVASEFPARDARGENQGRE